MRDGEQVAMGIRSWLRGHRTVASVTALAVLVSGPVALAVIHQGFPISDVDLIARDVWVTNSQRALTGRLNMQIEELNGAVSMPSKEFDVYQDGSDVFTFDSDKNTVERVDPAFTTRGQKLDVPAGSTVSYGGGRLAILSNDGKLWIIDATGQLQFAPEDAPVVELGEGSVAAVAVDGTVWGLSVADGELWRVLPDQFVPEKKVDLNVTDPVLSTVGSRAVILDRDRNALIFDDATSVQLADDAVALRLQQPGPERSEVVVATAGALLRVGFDKTVRTVQAGDTAISGSSTSMDGDRVAAPVVLGTCIHGAWATTSSYLGVCEGRKDTRTEIEDVPASSRLEFRVNHSVIALNDIENGRLWVPGDNMVPVDNWDVVTPPPEQETEESDEESLVQSFEETLAERKEENTPPLARNDVFGVRPAKTTIIPLLDNDTDPDGDVLTILNISDVPASSGRVQFIDGGRALQFVPADGALSGTVSFRYTVSDGRPGGIAEAQANIEVHPDAQNAAPAATRISAVAVETGATISHAVLTDWLDPDGDDLTLVGATSDTGDTVRFTPDGLVTFTAISAEYSDKNVTLTVFDGRTTTTGSLVVQVKAAGSLKPIGTPDFVTAFAGDKVEVSPLDNDQSPSGAALKLSSIEALTAGVNPVADYDNGTVRLAVGTPGTYYLEYGIDSGGAASIGIIRVDVLPDPDATVEPIAVKDTAYVRPNEPTTLDALLNDSSPGGTVLAIQSIHQEQGARATVEILSSTQIRITTPSAMPGPEELTYTISDGSVVDGVPVTSTAGITIVPVPELVQHQAPIAKDDAIKVRAGDVASIAVMDNDYHPDGARMYLDAQIVQSTLPVDDGLVFVTDDEVRIQAPEAAGIYTVTYGIHDNFKENATARVTVTVVERDAETNAAPVPSTITARVFQNAAVQIDVPLDGVDPDGDSLVFVSAGGSSLGEIVASETTSTSFTYLASRDKSGTDVFGYEVRDTFGLAATGEVRIAVIPRGETVMAPTAVQDQVAIRPGRVASVPVIANDSDPNGYSIALSKDLLEVQKGISAEVVGDNVEITAGEDEDTYSFDYQIDNGNSPPVPGNVVVTVDKSAPIQPPTAIDHVIETSEVIGQREYTVDALAGAGNPGGKVNDLVVELDGPNAAAGTVNADGTVTMRLRDTRVAIAYRVTNVDDDLSALAFIVVPKYSDAEPPSLKQEVIDEPPVVNRDTPREFTLGDILDVPSGRPAILIKTAEMTAGRGEMVSVDKDTFRFTPEAGYYGDTVLTFTVTDGSSASDASGNTAIISMKVSVGDPEGRDIPPTFANATLEIEPGEVPMSLDLRAASSHPNPDVVSELTYDNFAFSSSQISARLDGDQLVASAPSGATGASAVATFDVKFGSFVVPAQVTVVVVASKRPLAQTVDDVVPDARPNSSYPISPLANDINPFADKGTPLQIVDAVFEGDGIGAQVSYTASGVTVQTGATKAGTISVIYTVEDSTGAVERQVQGRITVVVRSAPEPVQNLTASRAGDGRFAITFQPPVSSNGAEVTGYEVRVSGSPSSTTRTDCAPGASCEFSGRTNGQLQTIVVDATNAVGTTTSSPVTVIPIGVPSAPTSPVYDTNSSTATARVTPTWGWPGNDGGGRSTGEFWFEWSASTGQIQSRDTDLNGTGANVGAGTYTFQVRSCTPGGCSAYVGDDVVIAPPPPPPARTWVTRSGNSVVYHWENLAAGSWPEVVKFRCYNVPPNQQSGTANIVDEAVGSFSTGTGSIAVPCGNAVTDSYSVEPWKFGPWLQIGGSWQQ